MKILNELGFAELLKQANAIYAVAISQDRHDWDAEINALEEKTARGDTPEIEVSSIFTKDKQTKFISLKPIHFDGHTIR